MAERFQNQASAQLIAAYMKKGPAQSHDRCPGPPIPGNLLEGYTRPPQSGKPLPFGHYACLFNLQGSRCLALCRHGLAGFVANLVFMWLEVRLQQDRKRKFPRDHQFLRRTICPFSLPTV